MQLYYLHNYGNMEATAVLIDAVGTEHNAHFQVLLEFFQRKFDGDRAACGRRRRRRRSLRCRHPETTEHAVNSKIIHI